MRNWSAVSAVTMLGVFAVGCAAETGQCLDVDAGISLCAPVTSSRRSRTVHPSGPDAR